MELHQIQNDGDSTEFTRQFTLEIFWTNFLKHILSIYFQFVSYNLHFGRFQHSNHLMILNGFASFSPLTGFVSETSGFFRGLRPMGFSNSLVARLRKRFLLFFVILC